MFELLEPKTGLPHLPDSVESGASVSQRRRIGEHLEDFGSELKDPEADVDINEVDNEDDDDNTGGDVPGVSILEPGWISF